MHELAQWPQVVAFGPFFLLPLLQDSYRTRTATEKQSKPGQSKARLPAHTKVMQQLNPEGQQNTTLHSALLGPLACQEGDNLSRCAMCRMLYSPTKTCFFSPSCLFFFSSTSCPANKYVAGGHVSYSKQHGSSQPSLFISSQPNKRLWSNWQPFPMVNSLSGSPCVSKAKASGDDRPWSVRSASGPSVRERHAQPRCVLYHQFSRCASKSLVIPVPVDKSAGARLGALLAEHAGSLTGPALRVFLYFNIKAGSKNIGSLTTAVGQPLRLSTRWLHVDACERQQPGKRLRQSAWFGRHPPGFPDTWQRPPIFQKRGEVHHLADDKASKGM